MGFWSCKPTKKHEFVESEIIVYDLCFWRTKQLWLRWDVCLEQISSQCNMLDAAFWGHIWVLRPKEDREDPCCLIKNNTNKRHACEALKKKFTIPALDTYQRTECCCFIWLFLEEDKFCLLRSHVLYTVREGGGGCGGEGGGGGRGRGKERGSFRTAEKRGEGRGEYKGGRGGPNMTCVSIYWNVCGSLLSAQTGWETLEERGIGFRPQTQFSAAKTTSTESSQCAQEGWEIGSEPSVYPKCLSPFLNYVCFF